MPARRYSVATCECLLLFPHDICWGVHTIRKCIFYTWYLKKKLRRGEKCVFLLERKFYRDKLVFFVLFIFKFSYFSFNIHTFLSIYEYMYVHRRCYVWLIISLFWCTIRLFSIYFSYFEYNFLLFGNMLIILSTKSKVFGMNSVSGLIFHQFNGRPGLQHSISLC